MNFDKRVDLDQNGGESHIVGTVGRGEKKKGGCTGVGHHVYSVVGVL